MTSVAIRHRLLEGVLLRLAKLPDAGGIVLRGGMPLRHWFWPTPRPALDLDLVAHSPLAVTDAMRFLPMFANIVADGVTFDVEGIAVEGIWLQSDHPGIRMHVSGAYAGNEDDIQVDVTGGPPPRPAAVMSELPTTIGAVRLWTCRPESIVGQKLQALWHLGKLGWRPKDLDDLRLLLERMPMDDAALREAISAHFRGARRHGPRRAQRICAAVVVEHETCVGTMGRFCRRGRPRRRPCPYCCGQRFQPMQRRSSKCLGFWSTLASVTYIRIEVQRET